MSSTDRQTIVNEIARYQGYIADLSPFISKGEEILQGYKNNPALTIEVFGEDKYNEFVTDAVKFIADMESAVNQYTAELQLLENKLRELDNAKH